MTQLRILCFGASLVAGFTEGGLKHTPYAQRMSEVLAPELPQLDISVKVDGHSGDMVTIGAFKSRMERRSRILCFGDSLTEGYSCYGSIFQPYSETFNDELRVKFSAWKGKCDFDVVTDGQSGDLASTGGFKRRMAQQYSIDTTRYPIYDWVLFLGGTNDLGWGKSAQEIDEALKTVTNIPLSKGSKVLMMTIPECAAKSKALDQRRNAVNAMIKEDKRENVYIFDLHASIPYHSMDEVEREEIWDDGLHLTSAGYERLGKLAAERLMEIFKAEENDAALN